MLTPEQIQKIESEMQVGQVWFAFTPWLSQPVLDVCEVEGQPGNLYFRSRGMPGGYSAGNFKESGIYQSPLKAFKMFCKSQDRLAMKAQTKANEAKRAAFLEFNKYRGDHGQ